MWGEGTLMAMTEVRKKRIIHIPVAARVARKPPKVWGPGWGPDGPTPEQADTEQLWIDLRLRGRRAEIVDGRIIVSPWAKRRHSRIVDRLYLQLHDVRVANGWECHQNWAVHIPPLRGDKRIPDLLVTTATCPEFDENQGYGYGALLAVEVTSEGSRHEDLSIKPKEYARAGVPLLLVLDDLAAPRTAVLFQDPGEHGYQKRISPLPGEALLLPDPFGVKIDLDAIFS
ncbi:Uma2 family endonuclease [Streptosporangiaceae bacterium NEAU-GS5]|nr:Uma2 family endonuclease [Streptosporangiaceae bacterium NEAU-GS5]